MRRRHRKKLTTPYVRRMKPNDYVDNQRVGGGRARKKLRAFWDDETFRMFNKVYVLVQHGWKNRVMISHSSKALVLNEIKKIRERKMTYKEWQRHTARISRDSDLNRRR